MLPKIVTPRNVAGKDEAEGWAAKTLHMQREREGLRLLNAKRAAIRNEKERALGTYFVRAREQALYSEQQAAEESRKLVPQFPGMVWPSLAESAAMDRASPATPPKASPLTTKRPNQRSPRIGTRISEEQVGLSPTEALWMVFEILYAHAEACRPAWDPHSGTQGQVEPRLKDTARSYIDGLTVPLPRWDAWATHGLRSVRTSPHHPTVPTINGLGTSTRAIR